MVMQSAITSASTSDSLLEVRLQSICYAAKDINIYEFVPLGDGALPPLNPGDHIDIVLPGNLTRQYSIINPGLHPQSYKIAVKLDAGSRGGSRYLHETARVGSGYHISIPRNNFALCQTAPFSIFFAGGIGITPVYAMARTLEAQGKSWQLHYAARTRADMAFLDELPGSKVNLHADNEHGGRPLDLAALIAAAPADAHLYCCGPKPMLEAFEAATTSWPAEQVHIEYFTAKHEADRRGGFLVQLAKSGLELLVPEGQTILDVVRAAGVPVMSSCEEGVCGSCETRLIAGKPEHRDSVLTEEERQANGTVMICCAGCRGDRLVLDL